MSAIFNSVGDSILSVLMVSTGQFFKGWGYKGRGASLRVRAYVARRQVPTELGATVS
jgi:hypothetical protein